MSKTAAIGFTRIELWIPDGNAEYANQVAGHFKTRRKLYLESVIRDHLADMRKTVRPVRQANLFPVSKKKKASKRVSKPK